MSNSVSLSSYGDFATVLILDLVLCIVVFSIFWILRLCNRYFYAPLLYKKRDNVDLLPTLGKGPHSWIMPTLRFSEDHMLEVRGLDAVIYLKFLKLLLYLFILYLPLGIGLLLPLDYTDTMKLNGIAELSIANLHSQSPRLWAHAIVAILFNFVAFYLLYHFYRDYMYLRIAWMRKDEPHNFTTMLEGIPTSKFENASPHQFFSTVFPPNEIVSVHIAGDSQNLRELLKEREETRKKLEIEQAVFAQTGIRPTHKSPPLIGRTADSIDALSTSITSVNLKIDKMLDTVVKYAHVGFVTFKSIGAAYSNSQILLNDDVTALRSKPAPDHRDIIWDKLFRPQAFMFGSKPVMYLVFFLLIFFWTIPIYFVQGLANLRSLASIKGFGWIGDILSASSIVTGILEGFLPALVVIIFFALLPTIITSILELRGVRTKSSLGRGLTRVFFLFLIVNVFFVSLLSGGAFNVLTNLLQKQSPEGVLTLLGTTLPAQANFFINYILTNALFSYPLRMLRIGQLIVAKLKKFTSKTVEQRAEAENPDPYPFHEQMAIELLICCIGITYAPLAPFAIIWVIVFFAMAYITAKYMFIFVYKPQYDSGGKFASMMFNRVIAGIIIGQLTMIGLFIFKKFTGGLIIFPLPIITYFFYKYVHKTFDPPANYLPVNHYPTRGNGIAHREAYVDPVMDTKSYVSVELQSMEEGAAGVSHESK